MIGTPAAGGMVLEFTALIAMVVYALIGWSRDPHLFPRSIKGKGWRFAETYCVGALFMHQMIFAPGQIGSPLLLAVSCRLDALLLR